MAEPAVGPGTVEAQAAPAEAPKEQPADRPGWLPEKFDSPEDLAKAYKELEQKQSQTAVEQEEGEEATEASESGSDESGAPAIQIPGLSAEEVTEMSTAWETTGQLSDAHYQTLASKGYTREVVDQFIAGRQNAQQVTTEQADAAIAEIKASVGGDQAYDAMIAWAKVNLNAEQAAAYDRLVSGSKEEAEAGVLWLKQQMDATEGTEGNMLSGGRGSGEGQCFKSTAEMREAMKDPKYDKDPAYQAWVTKMTERGMARGYL